ncbi:carboxypeptidase M32 [Desulfogranum japonicum]|uniref:carboxypeptidase M32 n=1 Tax=Desulfogranum japonicum TaxID=231447 RepID=UPI0003FCFC35|nr:carboxypeptidase M32 [Desulfogranum japonicum]
MNQEAYTQLTGYFQKLSNIGHALTFLHWDQLVMMPPGGNAARASSIAELTSLHHEHLTSPTIRDLLLQAKEEDLTEIDRTSLHEMERVYHEAVCLPQDLVKKKSLAGSLCEQGWRTQRENNDWQGFLKNFQEVVMLAREEAQARLAANGSVSSPYDAMLDLYCTGDTTEEIETVFTVLQQELPQLIGRICEQQKAKPHMQGPFPIEQQKKLCRSLMSCLGFDFEAGRIDVSLHPFSTGDMDDQRITTRFRDSEFLEALLATAHETGHAKYEAGLPKNWHGLPIGEARNMCIHESQSLLFEKHLFLAKPFFHFFVTKMHKYLPTTRDMHESTLYAACTHVEPSLIRVEADEATYPLHVILRFEIERDLINGKIEAKDIPELWDDKMQQHFGLDTHGNYKDGCLQDIHWADGSFGYFPSYTMGAVNAAQIFQAFTKETTDWQEAFATGNTADLREWLQNKVWSKASGQSSQDIIKGATGMKTDARSLLNHLKNRYL